MAATGAEVDFRALFEEQFAYVWSVLVRVGVRTEDVEDLAHEVFLSVYRRLADYDPARPPRPWLFGFAVRVAAAHRRRAHRRYEVLALAPTVEDGGAPADQQLVDHEERSLLLRALDELDLDRRAVLVAHEWDGVPIPELARALGIPLNTAYSRLRSAREDLAAAVRRLSARRGQ